MRKNPDLTRLRDEYAERKKRLGHSDLYSPFNLGHLFSIQQRQRAVLSTLRRNGFSPIQGYQILEIGCGEGGVLQEYSFYGATVECLHGTDLLFDRLQVASKRLPRVSLTCADAQYLPYKSGIFDLVMQYTVFSSILDEEIKFNLARELLRVLKPGGIILWYDFWLNPTNKQTSGIRPKKIRQLFPDCSFEFKRITLAPPIARYVTSISWIACEILESIKIFNSHYLVAIRP